MVCLRIIRGEDPKLITVKFTPLTTALPFNDEKKTVACDNDEELDETEYSELDTDEEVANYEGMRIGTRAHIPYNLQGCNKNAMLIFNATVEYFPANVGHIPVKIADIAATFVKFRFEIEQHIDLTESEIDKKCHEFFQRDFSDYGCVAVVAIALDGLGFDESTIVRHWRSDGNPTLRHKPKIYIHEGQLRQRLGWPKYRRGSFYSSPITEDHPDVLCLHMPAWPHDLTTRPVQTLCRKLEDLADYDDLVTIIKESIRETKPMYRAMIFVTSTLERRLFLSRTEHEVTRL